jgi:glutathione S-transferase
MRLGAVGTFITKPGFCGFECCRLVVTIPSRRLLSDRTRDSTRTPMSTARGCWARDYAFNRYQREAERHCQVLNNSFEGHDYIVGNGYTLVDMSA